MLERTLRLAWKNYPPPAVEDHQNWDGSLLCHGKPVTKESPLVLPTQKTLVNILSACHRKEVTHSLEREPPRFSAIEEGGMESTLNWCNTTYQPLCRRLQIARKRLFVYFLPQKGKAKVEGKGTLEQDGTILVLLAIHLIARGGNGGGLFIQFG